MGVGYCHTKRKKPVDQTTTMGMLEVYCSCIDNSRLECLASRLPQEEQDLANSNLFCNSLSRRIQTCQQIDFRSQQLCPMSQLHASKVCYESAQNAAVRISLTLRNIRISVYA